MNNNKCFCIFIYFLIISLGSIFCELKSTSASTGFAPLKIIEFTVEQKVSADVITSSFFLNLMISNLNEVQLYMNSQL